jgi:putative MATE family efflux protein
MAQIRDMTQGSPTRHIIAFALPVMLGNIFQQMYSMVDTMVVGNVLGVEALAAVGGAGWLDWLVLGFVLGMTQGFSILISQRFGSGDHAGMRRAVTMSALMTAATIIVVTTLSVSMCRQMLMWMNTPAESLDLAHKYLRVIYLGIPVSMSYNLFAGMLRALGDSRTPLVAMIIASLVNIVLDIVFVAYMGMGVEGAALATVLGQLFSALFCLMAVRKVPYFILSREDWRIDKATLKRLSRLAFPIAGQNTFVGVGGVIMQSIINGFGVILMAGVSTAARLSGMLEIGASSVGSAMHPFAGQNLGAGRYDRIRDGVKKALMVAVSIAVTLGIIGIIFGRPLLGLFIADDTANADLVLDAAYNYFRVLCIMMFALYALHVFRSTLQGMGEAVFTVASSFLQVLMRTAVTYGLSRVLGETGICIGDTLAWFSAAAFLMVVYIYKMKRLGASSAAR